MSKSKSKVDPLPPLNTEAVSPIPSVIHRTGCLVEGCDCPHKARGLCGLHYRKAYYAANADRAKAQARQWRVANPEGASGG